MTFGFEKEREVVLFFGVNRCGCTRMFGGFDEALEACRRFNDRLRRIVERCCSFVVGLTNVFLLVWDLFKLPSMET